MLVEINSLIFAPMEGVTNSAYRKVIQNLYPEWDYLYCDFLRIAGTAPYPDKFLIKHFGAELYRQPQHLQKTCYQILTSPGAQTEYTVKQLFQLGFKWIDLNLGCPSNTVNKRKGGSYLLSDMPALREIIDTIRKSYPARFTVKMRTGFNHDHHFEETLRMLCDLGVDAITIHGRTRLQMYKGLANWDAIKKAQQISTVPIIGNGDLWTLTDIEHRKSQGSCHSFMIARGALQNPWLAKEAREKWSTISSEKRIQLIEQYLNLLVQEWRDLKYDDYKILKNCKNLSRYIFNPLPQGELLKSQLLRSQKLAHYFYHFNNYQQQITS